MDNNDNEESIERQEAEIEFVTAAYSTDEAWISKRNTKNNRSSNKNSNKNDTVHESITVTTIHRRLVSDEQNVSFVLCLDLPPDYPVSNSLIVHGTVEDDKTSTKLIKKAYDALPNLIHTCQTLANSMVGEESVFTILNHADEWIQEQWIKYELIGGINDQNNVPMNNEQSVTKKSKNHNDCDSVIVLGRNLIYSHHIIGKQKRADMKVLGSQLNLTGYVKIGWPGIIIIEGKQEDCIEFYDTIRRWAWQYLVLRGEMKEIIPTGTLLDSKRKFTQFIEIDNMSIVANHCRNVGLEELFLTSMKIHANSSSNSTEKNNNNNGEQENADDELYGALIIVDHMNDGKGYRKWLRKTCDEMGILALLLKQCYPNNDFTKKPLIVVGIIGPTKDSVTAVLKKWRTCCVDVDSRGKPCLERMMTILVEDVLEDNIIKQNIIQLDDNNELNAENQINTTREKLLNVIQSIGLHSWADAIKDL